MDDRTLLERAAKAAGYTLKWGEVHMIGDDEIDCTDQPYVVSGQPDEADWYWDPLNDDGDEARLEAACVLNVLWGDTCVTVVHNLTDIGRTEFFADHGGDKQKARRRAGVRAAAEIGGE